MHFEITKDAEYVKYCLTHPAVWRHIQDDAANGINPKLFFPSMNGVIYVKAGDYGLILGKQLNLVNYDVHIALLPNARGSAADICKKAIEWWFGETVGHMRLTTSILSNNHLARRLVESVGMEFIGVNRKSFQKNGCIFDQYLYGLSKEQK